MSWLGVLLILLTLATVGLTVALYAAAKRLDYLHDRIDSMKKDIVSTNLRIDLVNRHLAEAHRRIKVLK